MNTRVFADDAFQGQRVLITGAGGGIGSRCAEMFHRAGAELILIDLHEGPLREVAAGLGEGTDAAVLAGDVTAREVREGIVGKVAELGGVDHLVLAAGIYQDRPIAEMTDEDFERTLSINLTSTFQLTRDLLGQLRDGGSVVNFASMAGERGSRHHAHYAATKGGLVSFGRSLAWEVGERGIRVNAVAPGIISTSMTQGLVDSGGEALLTATPLRRFGEPEDVASAVLYLCSDAASFLTGVTLQVNGGLHMA
ncbi:SDR family NAD(P)-dependent oxidoreductase [Rothia halotolerans]|uniref:SDR family NAD(P)-dependent oxidoreductase n=1 Tax=Rothia halotolerans TaxID=405770 RepID=UPI00101C94C9|nr:SDR family NAD(P)-dependent oxidoreductase [Rothia halotolerans]